MRPAGVPDAVERLLEDDHALMLGESDELRRDQRDELRRRLPELRALVEELEAFGIPATIQHDDLHDGQVFVRDGDVRILDWGDSCISHPFHTLTVTLRALAWRHGIEPSSVELLRLRDAYLEPLGFAGYRRRPRVSDRHARPGTRLAPVRLGRHSRRARPRGRRERSVRASPLPRSRADPDMGVSA